MEAIKDSFFEEYDEVEFDIKETKAGTKLLIAKIPGGREAYVYTIYKGHELEMEIVPGAFVPQGGLTETRSDVTL